MRPECERDRMGVRAFLSLMAFGALLTAAVYYSIPTHADPQPQMTAAEKAFADHGGALGVCGIFDGYGVTDQTVLGAIKAVANVGGFPIDDSTLIVNYSVYLYCPKYWPALVQIGSNARASTAPTLGVFA
jgi:hypothetical protein